MKEIGKYGLSITYRLLGVNFPDGKALYFPTQDEKDQRAVNEWDRLFIMEGDNQVCLLVRPMFPKCTNWQSAPTLREYWI